MDRQTLRDWVHRYNAEGVTGRQNRTVPQRPRRLVPQRPRRRAAWVEAAPDPVRDGVVRWRRRDLQHRIAAEFGVTLHERTLGKHLAALGFRRLQVAPPTPEVGPAGVRQAFKKLSRSGSCSDPRAGTGQAA